ncbi:hypothetical protein M422DRAFT_779256 [Sphaerobolus stellatus SS14]|uniref:Cytochrome P450 n=1 Tax=Sphaerobolus stellatus (strain SS14) TaxID=990650 RepID=A0A0C9VR08_SPHS4|nr:hypothetical protein M422DRAFT_779256 [Sphaerobolus stellatus SS14]
MVQFSSIFERLTTRYLYAVLGAAAAYTVLHQLSLRHFWFSPLRKVPGLPFDNLLYGQFLNILKRDASTTLLVGDFKETEMCYPPLEGCTNVSQTPEKGIEVLVYDWMGKVNMDIIFTATFGYYPENIHDDKGELIHAYQKLFDLQSGLNFATLSAAVTFIPEFHHFLPTNSPTNIENICSLDFFQNFVRDLHTIIECVHHVMDVAKAMLVEKLREADVKTSETKKDIMNLLIKRVARLNGTEDGYKMADQDLLEHALTFLRGHATAVGGFTWTLWLLATHPEYQERLRAEVLPAVADNPRPDYNTLKDLKLLNSIEIHNMESPNPSLCPYDSPKGCQVRLVDGYFIPKGTILYIFIRVANTYPGTWGSDEDEFRPNRWFDLPPTYDPKFLFLGFTASNYSCLARPMAIMELRAIIAVTIAHFAIVPAYEGQVAKPIGIRMMKPGYSMPLRVKAVGKLPNPL